MNKSQKKLLNVKSTIPKLSDSWKLPSLNLIFWRKWAKVREKQLWISSHIGKKANELEMDLSRKKERKKERKRLGEFLQIYDQKDQEIVECEIEYSQVIRFMKTSKLEKINFLEKVNETERKW